MSEPDIEPQTLVELVRRAALRWPARTAWTFDESGAELTFADVDRRTDALAAGLATCGIGAGDRVAIMLANRPEFPLGWLALAKLGAAMVPVNINYRRFDATHVLRHSRVRHVLTDGRYADLLHAIVGDTRVEHVLDVDAMLAVGAVEAGEFGWPAVVPETIANVQYTSGTTGGPKGCVLPHRYWTTLASGLVNTFPNVCSDDVILTAQPFHYMDPQWNVALGLLSGARLVVLDRFHPTTFWAKVREHEVSWFYCLGLMPKLLLDRPPATDDHHHRVRAISASAIPLTLQAQLELRWNVPWFEAFGLTETGSDIRLEPRDHDATVGTGCLGRPLPGREMMIVDEAGEPVSRGTTGELVVRGIGMMHGYFDDPDATAHAFRGGWFHTGDLAWMDSEGRAYFVGRTKDMIRRSGENISAAEVERVLQLHPAVALTAVLAEPDELRGEEVHAVVVTREGQQNVPVAELIDFCREQLAYFKVPRYWTFVECLPMTASERVAKGELRAALDADADADADASVRTFDAVTGRWLVTGER